MQERHQGDAGAGTRELSPLTHRPAGVGDAAERMEAARKFMSDGDAELPAGILRCKACRGKAFPGLLARIFRLDRLPGELTHGGALGTYSAAEAFRPSAPRSAAARFCPASLRRACSEVSTPPAAASRSVSASATSRVMRSHSASNCSREMRDSSRATW